MTNGTNTTAVTEFNIVVTADSLTPTQITNTGLTLAKGTSATITRSRLEVGDPLTENPFTNLIGAVRLFALRLAPLGELVA